MVEINFIQNNQMPRGGKRHGAGRKKKAATQALETPKQPTTPVPASVAEAPELSVGTLDPATVDNPHGLTPLELRFVEAYCGVARYNATKAHELAGYSATTYDGRRTNAHKVLTKDHVQKAVAARLSAQLGRLASPLMDGDEALSGVSNIGRIDIRGLFDSETGGLKKIKDWPDEVAHAVKAITPNAYGVRIEMYDKLRALELMAKAAGRLTEKHEHEHKFTLEDIVAGNAPPQNGAAA